MNNVVIVPLRSGSKGLKNKNTKSFVNLPLYYWTIKKLYNLMIAGKIDKIIVSSDSDWYLSGVESNFSFIKDGLILSKRPDFLSTDATTTEEVCLHELEKYNINEGILSIVEVTSPLVPVDALSLMFSAIAERSIDIVSSFLVYKDIGQFWKCNKTNEYKWEKLYTDRKMRQQETEILYREVGAWSVKVEEFKQYKNRIIDPCLPIIIDKEYGCSINDENDFLYAEMLMKENSSQIYKDMGLYR